MNEGTSKEGKRFHRGSLNKVSGMKTLGTEAWSEGLLSSSCSSHYKFLTVINPLAVKLPTTYTEKNSVADCLQS
ncbi:hypothetical protein Pyn_22703 [Prunus yedoensis var. nudiflora]|uniref:Uncharacterized protein n=1 Tax=Prunus yedoensis var. nudiflora TaxID=2094558 RepID=A0A314YAR1_PRUYE|nr:hypothetical protein Pyn_22703 [Prunus yedoensis var. nudiflora]